MGLIILLIDVVARNRCVHILCCAAAIRLYKGLLCHYSSEVRKTIFNLLKLDIVGFNLRFVTVTTSDILYMRGPHDNRKNGHTAT